MKLINEKDIFLLSELVRKNFSSQYKDSFLGIIWSVLHPLLMVITLTIIFSTLLGRNIENYPVYLLAGRTIFRYFTGTVGSSMNVLRSNKSILTTNPAPKHIFVLARVISAFVDFIISFVLLIVIMIITNAPFHFETMHLAIIPAITLVIATTGMSLIMSVATVYYTDIKYLWSVVVQLLLYTSAVFYSMDAVPEPYHQYLLLNPLFWLIDQFRDFMLYGIVHDPLNVINSIILSFIILIIGIVVFKKCENNLIIRL